MVTYSAMSNLYLYLLKLETELIPLGSWYGRIRDDKTAEQEPAKRSTNNPQGRRHKNPFFNPGTPDWKSKIHQSWISFFFMNIPIQILLVI